MPLYMRALVICAVWGCLFQTGCSDDAGNHGAAWGEFCNRTEDCAPGLTCRSNVCSRLPSSIPDGDFDPVADSVDTDPDMAEEEDVTEQPETTEETETTEGEESGDLLLDTRWGNVLISDCYGFNRPFMDPDSCRDEELHWSWDPDSKTMTVLNTNVWINCWGERDLVVLKGTEPNAWEIRETDNIAPEKHGACRCMIDFQVELYDVIDPIELTLSREESGTGVTGKLGAVIHPEALHGSFIVKKSIGWCSDTGPVRGMDLCSTVCPGVPGIPALVDTCDGERLDWSYDVDRRAVQFRHSGVHLNCSGNRRNVIMQKPGHAVYEIREFDNPDTWYYPEHYYRTRCFCHFDYSMELDNVGGDITIQLTRKGTFLEGSPMTDIAITMEHILSTTIDLDQGMGTILLGEPRDSCYQNSHFLDEAVSACGGFEDDKPDADPLCRDTTMVYGQYRNKLTIRNLWLGSCAEPRVQKISQYDPDEVELRIIEGETADGACTEGCFYDVVVYNPDCEYDCRLLITLESPAGSAPQVLFDRFLDYYHRDIAVSATLKTAQGQCENHIRRCNVPSY